MLSYNIRSMRDDHAALVRVIRGCRPDVVCLQEVPRLLGWRHKAGWLARETGLTIATWRRNAGLAVFAAERFQVVYGQNFLLSRVPRLHRRGLAVAVLKAGARRFIVASTHLDLAAKPRYAHAVEIITLLDRVRTRYAVPAVLAGDINEEPGGAAWDHLASRMPDCFTGSGGTYSAANPRRRIDGIFADPEIAVVRCDVPADSSMRQDFAQATDHCPVLAELRMPTA